MTGSQQLGRHGLPHQRASYMRKLLREPHTCIPKIGDSVYAALIHSFLDRAQKQNGSIRKELKMYRRMPSSGESDKLPKHVIKFV